MSQLAELLEGNFSDVLAGLVKTILEQIMPMIISMIENAIRDMLVSK